MRKEEGNWRAAQIGLELAASVGLGFWAGYWLDGKLGSAPWLMLCGAACGLAAGFYLMWRELSDDDGPKGGAGA